MRCALNLVCEKMSGHDLALCGRCCVDMPQVSKIGTKHAFLCITVVTCTHEHSSHQQDIVRHFCRWMPLLYA